MGKKMKTALLLMLVCMGIATDAHAQRNSGRLSLGVGLLYENGMDVTLAYEHEMNYRHMWEFFANGYLKWAECGSCGHVCPESFWRNYRTYGFGVAYKPCVVRGRNHYGNLRIGASAGSDTKKFLAGIHLCVAVGLDAVLAGQGRYDDKRGGLAADRRRAGCETADKIREK